MSRAYSLLMCFLRWGLCCTASCSVLLHRVSCHTDSSWREDGHLDRWHPVTNLWGQAHWEVIWWVCTPAQVLLDLTNTFNFSRSFTSHFLLISDFIKVERDDPVNSKGKGTDHNKWDTFFPFMWLLHALCNPTSCWDMFRLFCWQGHHHTSTWYFKPELHVLQKWQRDGQRLELQHAPQKSFCQRAYERTWAYRKTWRHVSAWFW